MRIKKKVSITLHPMAMRRIKDNQQRFGLSRSAAINMLIMKKRKRR